MKPILLLKHPRVDHFQGVGEALSAKGVPFERLIPEHTPIRDIGAYSCVALTTVLSPHSIDAVSRARGARVPVVLLMDGVVERRNTFSNPAAGPAFLRPAPVSLIACCGAHDRRLLTALGNNAVATGLPRLDHLEPLAPPERPRLLVATARQACFDGAEETRLVESLARVRDCATARHIATCWRIAPALADRLGVTPVDEPLETSLAACSAVLSTPSTVLVESMLCGRPTGALHPFGGACWVRAPICARTDDAIEIAIERLLAPDENLLDRQRDALGAMSPTDGLGHERVAALLEETASGAIAENSGSVPLPSVERVCEPMPTPESSRTVLCVEIRDGEPTDHVADASTRLGPAPDDPSTDVAILLIAHTPRSPFDPGVDAAMRRAGLCLNDPRIRVCVTDPSRGEQQARDVVEQSLSRMGATHVEYLGADASTADLRVSSKRPEAERRLLLAALTEARDRGCARLAIYPSGRRAHRLLDEVHRFETLYGVEVLPADDALLSGERRFGRKALAPSDRSTAIDAVILCADGDAERWSARWSRAYARQAPMLNACDDAAFEAASRR